MTPVSVPSASLKQQHVEPATPHSLLQFPGFAPRQSHRNGSGGLHCFGSQSFGAPACADALPGRSAAGTAAATRAPPMNRIAPRRGIGRASVRARSSRKSVIGAPAATAARLDFRKRVSKRKPGKPQRFAQVPVTQDSPGAQPSSPQQLGLLGGQQVLVSRVLPATVPGGQQKLDVRIRGLGQQTRRIAAPERADELPARDRVAMQASSLPQQSSPQHVSPCSQQRDPQQVRSLDSSARGSTSRPCRSSCRCSTSASLRSTSRRSRSPSRRSTSHRSTSRPCRSSAGRTSSYRSGNRTSRESTFAGGRSTTTACRSRSRSTRVGSTCRRRPSLQYRECRGRRTRLRLPCSTGSAVSTRSTRPSYSTYRRTCRRISACTVHSRSAAPCTRRCSRLSGCNRSGRRDRGSGTCRGARRPSHRCGSGMLPAPTARSLLPRSPRPPLRTREERLAAASASPASARDRRGSWSSEPRRRRRHGSIFANGCRNASRVLRTRRRGRRGSSCVAPPDEHCRGCRLGGPTALRRAVLVRPAAEAADAAGVVLSAEVVAAAALARCRVVGRGAAASLPCASARLLDLAAASPSRGARRRPAADTGLASTELASTPSRTALVARGMAAVTSAPPTRGSRFALAAFLAADLVRRTTQPLTALFPG